MTADTNFHLRRIATALERIASHLEAAKPEDKPPAEIVCRDDTAKDIGLPEDPNWRQVLYGVPNP